MTASTKPDLNQVVASRRRAIDPALGETCLTSLSDLNRLVRTRMLGGEGRAVSNGRPYPIRRPKLSDRAPVQGSARPCHAAGFQTRR